MASIYIVEDEPIIRQDLVFCVEDLGHEVVGQASNYEKAIAEISRLQPDLTLLDINLDGDKDGIDLGQKLYTELHIQFIYITSFYDKPTVERAKHTFPAAYVLKPFDEEDLKINIDLALLKKRKTVERFESSKLFVKNNQDLVAILPSEIIYLEADDNYCRVYSDKGPFILAHTLKKTEEKLADKGFLRIHKSYLINFERIDIITEGMVHLGDHQLPIGKAYKADLQAFLVTL
ncbi:LytR/AlgR family response regulator transcription factor [Marinoscillum sp.]|uniref:LytR/AlgR family response regulator transcription factor n=1 Tax=Marinoscillum sp. TaxID=2024838 RepID=UPI003BA96F3B